MQVFRRRGRAGITLETSDGQVHILITVPVKETDIRLVVDAPAKVKVVQDAEWRSGESKPA